MNLKDKFTFQFGEKTIQVEKLGEAHCAIHPRKGKDPLADPLMFSYADLTNKEICIFKKSTKLMLTTIKASDITKPEPNEQKEMVFEGTPIKLGGLRILELENGDIQITAAGNGLDLLTILPKSANSIIIKYT